MRHRSIAGAILAPRALEHPLHLISAVFYTLVVLLVSGGITGATSGSRCRPRLRSRQAES